MMLEIRARSLQIFCQLEPGTYGLGVNDFRHHATALPQRSLNYEGKLKQSNYLTYLISAAVSQVLTTKKKFTDRFKHA